MAQACAAEHVTTWKAAAIDQAAQLLALFELGGSCGCHRMASVEPLAGYDDLNLQLCLPDGRAFLLKVHSTELSRDPAFLEAQSAAMAHALACGVPTSRPLPTLADPARRVALVTLAGRQHAVRLLSWLPGSVIGRRRRCSPPLLRSWGCMMGRASAALAGFDAAPLHTTCHPWHMAGAADVIEAKAPGLPALSQQQRLLLLSAASQLRSVLGELGGQLPSQVCHTDGNEANLLCCPQAQQVTALLDWGDACLCWRVCEPGIAMAYAGILAAEHQGDTDGMGPQQNPGDLAQAMLAVLDGFREGLAAGGGAPLSAAELRALPAVVAGRVALSLTHGLAAAAQEPGNAAYLLATQRGGWALLEWLGQAGGFCIGELQGPPA